MITNGPVTIEVETRTMEDDLEPLVARVTRLQWATEGFKPVEGAEPETWVRPRWIGDAIRARHE